MNFMFSWQEQYLTRSLRSLVRYCSCHSNIKFISSRYRVISSMYFMFWCFIPSLTSISVRAFLGLFSKEYYTVARRYEFYVRVARTISHEWAQRTSGILFLPREHKVHIFELTCNVLFIILTNLMIFRRFPTTFRRFPKIFQNCSEGQTNVSEHFPRISENYRRCPKIAEDCRRLSRKTRRYFDDTPTNLSIV